MYSEKTHDPDTNHITILSNHLRDCVTGSFLIKQWMGLKLYFFKGGFL
ncbi:hypothetical protein LSO9J_170004 [Candidatus Liberibacter solanacearum]